MRFWVFISFLSLLFAGASLHAEAKKGDAKPKVDRTDLNQVDVEQVDEEWDSNPKQADGEIKRSIRLKEIMEPSTEYNYASFGRPDPFLAPDFGSTAPNVAASNADQVQSAAPTGKDILITSPLQAYPLNSLSVKGVWQLAGGEVRAMVATPKGEGVIVKEGDPISSGKVLNISREKLTVRLYRLREDGVREYQDSVLTIGGPSDKGPKGTIKLEPGKDPMFPTAAGEGPVGLPLGAPPAKAEEAADKKAVAAPVANDQAKKPAAAPNDAVQAPAAPAGAVIPAVAQPVNPPVPAARSPRPGAN